MGKEAVWPELEITGGVRNLSPGFWKLSHLTALYLNNNNLLRIPSEISALPSLRRLDLSSNQIKFVPPQIGDLVQLREMRLNNNLIRTLPFEMGRCFQLHSLGLSGNPLSQEITIIYRDLNSTRRLLDHMLDNLNSKSF